MNLSRWIEIGLLAMVMGLSTGSPASGAESNPYANTSLFSTEIQKPSDLMAILPMLGMIPKNYFFTGNYKIQLTRHEMRIDHIASDSRCTMKERTCMISIGYAQPVNQSLGSTLIELPLFSSDGMATNHWEHGSMGDYVLHMTDTPMYSPSVQIHISARFN